MSVGRVRSALRGHETWDVADPDALPGILRPVRWVVVRRRSISALVFALVATVVLVTACGGPAGPNPATGSIRASDVPAGWTRCAWSGAIARYLPLARKDDAGSAGAVARSWAAQRKVGATSAQMSGYVASRSDCSKGLGQSAGASALTWTIAYASAHGAHRGYEAGVLGLPTPDPDRIQTGLQVGPSTGLGLDSWTLTQTSPGPPLFLAWWHQGSLTNFLVVVGLPATTANPIALRLDARMYRSAGAADAVEARR